MRKRKREAVAEAGAPGIVRPGPRGPGHLASGDQGRLGHPGPLWGHCQDPQELTWAAG